MAKTKTSELVQRMTPELRELLEKVPTIADDIIQMCVSSKIDRPTHRFTLYDFQRAHGVPLVSALATGVLKQELNNRPEVRAVYILKDDLEMALTEQAKEMAPEAGAEMEAME